jgi:hypothetical protein
MIALLQRKEAN